MPNITTNHAITYTNTKNLLGVRLFPCDVTIEFVITGANSGNSIAKQIP